VATNKFGTIMAGLSGVFLLIIGLITLGLTQSPRPTSIPPEIYAKMRQVEWVIAILFVGLGMWIVRTTMVKLSNPPEER
jgi:membrane-bound ClpP family serine protease